MKMYFSLVLLIMILASTVAVAQLTVSIGTANLHPGKIGLGLDGITGSPNLLLKVFLSKQVAAQLILGVSIDSPGGDPPPGITKVTGTELRGGISILYHITDDQVTPYVGIEGVVQNTKDAGFFSTEPDAKRSIQAGAIFGAEYFIVERFSLGIQQMLGFDVALQRDIPKEETEVRFATSTLMTGRFYFN